MKDVIYVVTFYQDNPIDCALKAFSSEASADAFAKEKEDDGSETNIFVLELND